MKYVILGAAGLLLSTSALAAAPQPKGMAPPASPAVASKDSDSLDASMIGNAITIDWPAKRADARAVDTKHIIAAAKAPMEAPTAETPSTTEMSDAVAPVADHDGVGGPDEPEAVTTAAVAPAASYRACSPGPGDDSCIQLYEPGVSEAYAAWQANSGMPGTEQTAMGGPEEPIEIAAIEETAAADESVVADEGDLETAAYEPLPEDAVMPASAALVEKDSPDVMAI